MSAQTRRRPGRPRIEEHDGRILHGALALIDAGKEVTVNAVVEASGVSRAALYRRWGRLTDLVAAALDHGRSSVIDIRLEGDLRQNIIDAYFRSPRDIFSAQYSDRRFRMRMHLVMADRELQRTYWRSHVTHRRVGIERALRHGVEQGVLRPDLDIDSSIDLINGVFYYQGFVRGVPLGDADALGRCRSAFETAWRGMLA
ncbi:TetR/AcrR family transcriptional regulator [Microbacterium esteraromaticum]|uniref:TetR/AcrR family transcriptional regulator n=1 Tax=Microbacterium esteraromaticum TaxID=57043 RepID=UPI002368E323|nr:TetR/AcrR family transcriptional regulator [Microbacterium esteraromaticum]WDH77483.1 TetR/AcrR family transcriptional regulator [Microbacterium esteraromaticum]